MYVEDNKIRKYGKQLPVFCNMRFSIFLYLFAFCGGHRSSLYTRDAFRYGEGDMYFVVKNGKIFLLNNLNYWPFNVPEDTSFRLIPFEEFINQMK